MDFDAAGDLAGAWQRGDASLILSIVGNNQIRMISARSNAPITLNARVSAWSLATAAVAGLVLSWRPESLVPIRLFAASLALLGIWSFCDEMGMRKPLVRAGFVAYSLAALARLLALMDPQSHAVNRHWLLVAFGMACSMLLWSVAYLHRQRELKAAGAIGALAAFAPIAALVAGHLVVGAGAALGAGALVSAAEGAPLGDLSALHYLDRLFGSWCVATAWFLLSGRIRSSS